MRSLAAHRSTTRRRAPRALVAVALVGRVVLAFAVLFGVVHAGGRYFYCEALGLSSTDPCAQAHRSERGTGHSDALGEHAADCCQTVTLAAMPQAAQAAVASVAPAAQVAVLPALWLAGLTGASAAWRSERAFERWRPPPRASSDARAQLMVFLI